MSSTTDWVTDSPGRINDEGRTPSLVHSAHSDLQVLSTAINRRVLDSDNALGLDEEYHPTSVPSGDIEPPRGLGLSSLPTQQTMTIADGMGKIGPQYHFERRTAPPDPSDDDDQGPIQLNDNFNPPPLEALPSDMSIGQIQGIRPSDSDSLSTSTPGPLLDSARSRYITPPPARLRDSDQHQDRPDTLSSGAQTHPNLQPDGQATPTYSLHSTAPSNLSAPTISPNNADSDPAAATSAADDISALGSSSPTATATAPVPDLNNQAISQPFDTIDTLRSSHTFGTEAGWQTIDSADNVSRTSPGHLVDQSFVSEIDVMREALAKTDITDRPRLTLAGSQSQTETGSENERDSRSNDADPKASRHLPPTSRAVQRSWQDAVAERTNRARLYAQLGLEDWEISNSGKLPNYVRRERGEVLASHDVKTALVDKPHPPDGRTDIAPPLDSSALRPAATSRRTSFLLLDADPKKEKRARPVSTSGMSNDQKSKQAKRSRTVSSEVQKKITQVKQRNHGGWVSPSVTRKVASTTSDKIEPNQLAHIGTTGMGVSQIDFGSSSSKPVKPQGEQDAKSSTSFWSRLRSMSVDVMHSKQAKQVYGQSSNREIRPQDSFVNLGSSTNMPLLPHASVRETSSRSLTERLSLFVPKRVDSAAITFDKSATYRLPRSPDRNRPVKQVPDPFKRLGPDDHPLASPVTTVIDDEAQAAHAHEQKKQDRVSDGLKRTFSTLGTSARGITITTRRATVHAPRSHTHTNIDEFGRPGSSPTTSFRGVKSKAKAEKLLGQSFDARLLDASQTPLEHRPSQESSGTDPQEIFRNFDWPGPPPRSRSRTSSNRDVPSLCDVDLGSGPEQQKRKERPISAAQKYALDYTRRNSGELKRMDTGSVKDGQSGVDDTNGSTTESAIARRSHSEILSDSLQHLQLVNDDQSTNLTSARHSTSIPRPNVPVRSSSLSGATPEPRLASAPSPKSSHPAQDSWAHLRKPTSNRSLRRRTNPTNIFPQPKAIASSPSLDTIVFPSATDAAMAVVHDTPVGQDLPRDQVSCTRSPLSHDDDQDQTSLTAVPSIPPATAHALMESAVTPRTLKRAVSFAPSPERHQASKSAQLSVLPYGPAVVSPTVRNIRRARSSIELARPLPPPTSSRESLLPPYPASLRAITPHVKFWTPVFRREDERGVGKYHTHKGRPGRGNREGASHSWRPYALALTEVSKPIEQPHGDRLHVTVQTKAYVHLFSLNENGQESPLPAQAQQGDCTPTPTGLDPPLSPNKVMPSILRRIASWSKLKMEDQSVGERSKEPTRAMFVELAHREVERREISPWTWLKIFEVDKHQVGTDDISAADEARPHSGLDGSRVRWYDDDYKKCLMEFKFEEDNDKEVWIMQIHNDMQHLRWTWKHHIDEKRMDALYVPAYQVEVLLRGVSISEASKKQFDSYTQLERRRERAMTYGGDPNFIPFDKNDTPDGPTSPSARAKPIPIPLSLKGILKKTKSMSQVVQRASLLLKDQDPTWWDMERVIQERQHESGTSSQTKTSDAVQVTEGSAPGGLGQLAPTISLDQVKHYWRSTIPPPPPPPLVRQSRRPSSPKRYYRKVVENGITITFSPSILENRDSEIYEPMPDLIKSFSEQTTSTGLITDTSQQSANGYESAAKPEIWQPKWDAPTSTSRASSVSSRHRRHRSIANIPEAKAETAKGARVIETPSPDSPGLTRSAPAPMSELVACVDGGDEEEEGGGEEKDPLSPHPGQRLLVKQRSVRDSLYRFAIPRPDDYPPLVTQSQKGSTRSRLSTLGDKFRFRKNEDEGVRGRRASRVDVVSTSSSSFSFRHLFEARGSSKEQQLLLRTSTAKPVAMMDHLPEEPMGSPHQAQKVLEAMDHVLSPDMGKWTPPRDWKVVEAEQSQSLSPSPSVKEGSGSPVEKQYLIPALEEVWGVGKE